MIKVTHLTKEYKIPAKEYRKSLRTMMKPPMTTIYGLQDICLEMKKGEMVGLVGLNGAGKTTLIKTLTGILTPTRGEVEVMGYCPCRQRKAYTNHIGVVMAQKSVLFYDLPVIESFKFFKSVYKIPDEKFDARLELFKQYIGIGDLLHIPVRKLSLGQRMKCEITASLLHEPSVLFLDEPTLGLDIISKRSILGLLKQINKDFGITLILTTHDIDDMSDLCERILLLDHGHLVYDGGIAEIEERGNYKLVELKCWEKLAIEEHKDIIYSVKYISERHMICKVRMEHLAQVLWLLQQYSSYIEDLNISDVSLKDVLFEFYAGK